MHFGRYIRVEFYNQAGLLGSFDNEVEMQFISFTQANGREEHTLKMYNLSQQLRKVLTSREDKIKVKIFATYKELSEKSLQKPFEIFSGEKLVYRDEYWNHPVQRAQNFSIISEIKLISDGYASLNLDVQDNFKDSLKTTDVLSRIAKKANIFFNYNFSSKFLSKLKTYKKGRNTSGRVANILISIINQNNHSFAYFHYDKGIALVERYKEESEIISIFSAREGITLDYSKGDIIGNPREFRKRKKANKKGDIAEYAKPSMIVGVPISRHNDFLFPGRPVKVLYNDTTSYYMIYGIKKNISNRENDFFNIELDLRVDFAEDIYRDEENK